MQGNTVAADKDLKSRRMNRQRHVPLQANFTGKETGEALFASAFHIFSAYQEFNMMYGYMTGQLPGWLIKQSTAASVHGIITQLRCKSMQSNKKMRCYLEH